MASKDFGINEEPHVANVGKHRFLFVPEMVGAKFASAYAKLTDVQKDVKAMSGGKASSTKHAKEESFDPDVMVRVSAAMVDFVCTFLVDDGERTRFRETTIPDRVLAQLIEWVAELYGGGSGNPEEAGGTSTS